VTLASKAYLILIFGFVLLVLSFVDNIVMSSSLDSIMERQSLFNHYVFVLLVAIGIVGQSLIFYLIRKKISSFNTKTTGKSSFAFQALVILSICVSASLFLYLIVLMAYQRAYYSDIFKSIVYSSYLFSSINVGLLIIFLLTWYKRNHGIVMLLYVLAFSAYLINGIVGIVILDIQLEGRSNKISFVTNPWDNSSLRVLSLTDFYKMTSIVSFTVAWLGTCLLLYHYSGKIGRSKFWFLVALPLVYYLGNIDLIRSAIFSYIVSSSPYLLSITQIVLGGAKQAGGFFFAISFILISRNVDSQKLKYYLMSTATGMMLLFSSNQTSLVQIIPYPPFGLATVSLVSISSFLLLMGLYSLAYSMAYDRQLLENARKIVNQKASRFLYDIGSAQWQKEIDKTIPAIMNSKSILANEDNVPTSLTEEEVKDYLYELSKEVEKIRDK